LESELYRKLYGDVFRVTNQQIGVVQNSEPGWKMASSVGGKTTGFRATYCLLDDPHNVIEAESETVRAETTRWFRGSLSSRFSDLDTGRLIIIKQRVHESDISGVVLSETSTMNT
jgi:hypothetical protein